MGLCGAAVHCGKVFSALFLQQDVQFLHRSAESQFLLH